MRELNAKETEIVSGGLNPDTGALFIIGASLAGGPFVATLGLTIGLGILFRKQLS